MHRFVVIVLTSLLVASAAAQSVRSLGMGGVLAPGGAAAHNPAYLAAGTEANEVALPLGLLNLALSDRIRPGSPAFDPLAAFDQFSDLNTLLLSPATSPDEIAVRLRFEEGVPVVSLRPEGGSSLPVTRGHGASFRASTEIPLGFGVDVPGLRVGVRPYLRSHGSVQPDGSLADLFRDGASSGALRLTGAAEAGIAGDVMFAMPVPLPDAVFPGTLYVGARGAPFVGLARVQTDGDVQVTATVDGNGDPTYAWAYDLDTFVSVAGDGGFGFGVVADLGVVAAMPMPNGTVTAGFSVHDLAFESWSGYQVRLVGDSETEGEPVEVERVPERRTQVARHVAFTATFAYDLDPAMIGAPALGSLLLAADASYAPGGFQSHFGGEAGFDVPFGTVLARAGAGYEAGPTFGVGAGLRFAGVGADLAFHGRRSPLTDHIGVGFAAGLVFGF